MVLQLESIHSDETLLPIDETLLSIDETLLPLQIFAVSC